MADTADVAQNGPMTVYLIWAHSRNCASSSAISAPVERYVSLSIPARARPYLVADAGNRGRRDASVT